MQLLKPITLSPCHPALCPLAPACCTLVSTHPSVGHLPDQQCFREPLLGYRDQERPHRIFHVPHQCMVRRTSTPSLASWFDSEQPVPGQSQMRVHACKAVFRPCTLLFQFASHMLFNALRRADAVAFVPGSLARSCLVLFAFPCIVQGRFCSVTAMFLGCCGHSSNMLCSRPPTFPAPHATPPSPPSSLFYFIARQTSGMSWLAAAQDWVPNEMSTFERYIYSL